MPLIKNTNPAIPANIAKVYARIQLASSTCGRNPDSITLIAASKTQSATAIREAYAAGLRAFGENYVQEAVAKMSGLADLDISWHFIGSLQANKTRAVAERFDWVHSISQLKIAERLSQQRPPELPALNVCLEVNLDKEANKSGVNLTELSALAHAVAALPRLTLRGLMAIPARRGSAAEQVSTFNRLTVALEQLRSEGLQSPLDTLSMGMSADLEAAITAGSTMVRVGTDIFGPRHLSNTTFSNTTLPNTTQE